MSDIQYKNWKIFLFCKYTYKKKSDILNSASLLYNIDGTFLFSKKILSFFITAKITHSIYSMYIYFLNYSEYNYSDLM